MICLARTSGKQAALNRAGRRFFGRIEFVFHGMPPLGREATMSAQKPATIQTNVRQEIRMT